MSHLWHLQPGTSYQRVRRLGGRRLGGRGLGRRLALALGVGEGAYQRGVGRGLRGGRGLGRRLALALVPLGGGGVATCG